VVGSDTASGWDDQEGRVAAIATEIKGDSYRHKFYGNYIITNQNAYMFGAQNGQGDFAFAYNDTVEWTSPHYIDASAGQDAFTVVGNWGWTWDCDSNLIRDMIFVGAYGSEDSVISNDVDGLKQVLFEVTCTVHVEDVGRAPIENATCSVFAGLGGGLVLSGLTNANGNVIGPVHYLRKEWNGTIANHANWNGGSGFAFHVRKDSDSTFVDSIIDWDDKYFHIELSQTGESQPIGKHIRRTHVRRAKIK